MLQTEKLTNLKRLAGGSLSVVFFSVVSFTASHQQNHNKSVVTGQLLIHRYWLQIMSNIVVFTQQQIQFVDQYINRNIV